MTPALTPDGSVTVALKSASSAASSFASGTSPFENVADVSTVETVWVSVASASENLSTPEAVTTLPLGLTFWSSITAPEVAEPSDRKMSSCCPLLVAPPLNCAVAMSKVPDRVAVPCWLSLSVPVNVSLVAPSAGV